MVGNMDSFSDKLLMIRSSELSKILIKLFSVINVLYVDERALQGFDDEYEDED